MKAKTTDYFMSLYDIEGMTVGELKEWLSSNFKDNDKISVEEDFNGFDRNGIADFRTIVVKRS